MRTLVIGAGGVGGYVGARLARAGVSVTIAARGEHGRALRAHGIELHGTDEVERVPLANVVASAAELDERFELIVLAVKWPELEQTCDALPNLLAPHGVVAPLLNGLTSEEVVARYVGAQRTLAAVAYLSAGILKPGAIYVHGHARLGLAPFRPGQEPDIERVAKLFESAGMPVRTHTDHRRMLWEKMVWNAPFNAICALTRRPSGVVVERMEPLVRSAMQEVLAVAAADGVALPEAMIDAMLQDVLRDRPTEVDILQGEVAERGARLGVAVPIMHTLAALVRGLEQRAKC